MATIVTRAGKGSPLTQTEVDQNFINLNTDKLDTSGLALGSAASPSLKFTGDPNTGLYSPGADQVALSTAGAERLKIDNLGNITFAGVGVKLVSGRFLAPTLNDGSLQLYGGDITTSPGANIELYGGAHLSLANLMVLDANEHRFRTANGATERMRIDSAGSVGIGVSPSTLFHVGGVARVGANNTVDAEFQVGVGATGNRNSYIDIVSDTTYADYGLRIIRDNTGPNAFSAIRHRGTGTLALLTDEVAPIAFAINTTERARIDSSGRLLVGTSSSITGLFGNAAAVQLNASLGTQALALTRFSANNFGADIDFLKSRNATVGAHTIVQSGDQIANLNFIGSDGTAFVAAAGISANIDGTPGLNDMPGRLVFSTTADGAATPTERMRIKSTGIVNIANTPTYADNAAATSGGLVAGDIYRKSDGTLMIRY